MSSELFQWLLAPDQDLWDAKGLKRTRRTYASPVGGLSLVPEIADDLQITEPTVSEHLKALEEYGLAHPSTEPGSWEPLLRPPDEVAEELGTLGKNQQRVDQNRAETEKFATSRALQDDEQDLTFQALIERGFRWVGPHEEILVPPEKKRL